MLLQKPKHKNTMNNNKKVYLVFDTEVTQEVIYNAKEKLGNAGISRNQANSIINDVCITAIKKDLLNSNAKIQTLKETAVSQEIARLQEVLKNLKSD